ncbi:hypothetical protein [Streptomyces sp. NPDC097619]|uniref:hypothetical protein n=1 Tax=Streptomyces sp. NPDC097619 TaxID=3157228 RepID=UPI00331C0BCC
MVNFLDDQRATRQMAGLLADFDKRLKALERTTQGAHSSIEGGSLDVYDSDGTYRGSVGIQPDGSMAVAPVNAPPPPTPTTPSVAPVLAGLVVSWDGLWDDAHAAPADLARIQVHTGPTAGFTPGPATLAGAIGNAAGGSVTLAIEGYTPVWVRLMAVNTAGVLGPASAAVSSTPRQAVGGDLLDGIVSELKIAAGAVTAAKVAVAAIDARALADAAVTAAKIGHAAVEAGKLATGAVTAASIAANAVTAAALAAGSVTAGSLAANSVTAGALAANSVTATKILAGAVTAGSLAADSVVAGKIAADSITGREIRALAVTAAHLAANSIEATHLRAGVVEATHIKAAAITAGKVAADAVTAGTIAVDAVTARELRAGAVTAAAMAAGSVVAGKIAADAVTAGTIAADAVTARELRAGSVTAAAVGPGAIGTEQLGVGADGNLIADGGFEGQTAAARLPTGTGWSIVSGGNGSPRAAMVDCTSATAVDRTHTLGTLRATPGMKVWLSTDYRVSADWAGRSVTVYVRWEDSGGATLGYSTVSSASGAAGAGWLTMSGSPTLVAPAQAVTGRIRIAATDVTAGTVHYDNVVCRIVVASAPGGARAELAPDGMRVFDAEGEPAISLVAGARNFLTLSSDGVAVATIDDTGSAGFASVAVADDLTIGGTPIGARLAESARGIVAMSHQHTAVTASAGELGFVELSFEADTERMYRIVLDTYADPAVAGGELVLLLRDGGSSTPKITSTQIQSRIYPLDSGGWQAVRMELVRSGRDLGAGLHRILSTFQVQSGPSGQSVRLFGAPEYPGLMYVEDVGPRIADTGVYNTGGGASTPPRKTYDKVYNAAWSGSYGGRSSYTPSYGNQLMQGYYSSTHGTFASLFGFPPALATDLAGAQIERVLVYLYFEHWYSSSGGKAVLKAHKHSSRPSTFSSDTESMTVSWSRNQGKWVDITSIFDSTTWRGIALDPGSSTSTYYGRARGVGEGYAPKLRVIYTK